MKAMFYTRYGNPDVLDFKDVDSPSPKPNEVRVKLLATSINASDWEFLTGTPIYARINGVRAPRLNILGSDVAGVVDRIGSDITLFNPGDEVLGNVMDTMGGFAEFVCAPQNALVKKS